MLKIQAECNSANTGEPSRKEPQHLNALLDNLLDPEKEINNQDTIDWCRWLVGGGISYEDFSKNGEISICDIIIITAVCLQFEGNTFLLSNVQ